MSHLGCHYENIKSEFRAFYVWDVEEAKAISMNKHGQMIGFAASTLAPLYLGDIVSTP